MKEVELELKIYERNGTIKFVAPKKDESSTSWKLVGQHKEKTTIKDTSRRNNGGGNV
jgi:hypothetical protein